MDDESGRLAPRRPSLATHVDAAQGSGLDPLKETRRMRAPLLVAALLSLAACDNSSDTGTGPGSSLNGTYELKTVDSKPLPVAFADSSLVSGRLTMTDSGWSQISVVLYAAGGSAQGDTLKLAGFWAASGTSLTFFDLGNTTTYTGSYTSTGINITTKTATLLSYSK
jgi:hypothetical protein